MPELPTHQCCAINTSLLSVCFFLYSCREQGGGGGMGGEGHGEKYWILRRTCLQRLEVCLVFPVHTNQPTNNNATNGTKW